MAGTAADEVFRAVMTTDPLGGGHATGRGDAGLRVRRRVAAARAEVRRDRRLVALPCVAAADARLAYRGSHVRRAE